GGADAPPRYSGGLVGRGRGASGWLGAGCPYRARALSLPHPSEDRLVWFVREAWPSPVTGTSLVAGELAGSAGLQLTVESEQLIVFGDGME
ncbi:hypothetical protein ACFWP5_47135, partial [Streptomyces sp. NPDC058469]